MKQAHLIVLLTMVCMNTIQSQSVYVDSSTGNDDHPGTSAAPLRSIKKAMEVIRSGENDIYTMILNPGLYVLDRHIILSTEKEMTDKRLVIEAAILPGDPAWTPEKMPVIISKSVKGEIAFNQNLVVGFLVDESHVTIRGMKFHGYFYPHTRYFPIARLNIERTDLSVEQCMFIGDANISQIQAGILANGNEVLVDHCIFYKLRNSVVFFLASGDGPKTGNGITNSIICGASQAVWTVSPDDDFRFEKNIVMNCRYVWTKNHFNTAKYSMDHCIIVNNNYDTGIADEVQLKPVTFEIIENNVMKEGDISLRLTGKEDKPFLDEVDQPLPVDYMHVIPGSVGDDLGAGLFKSQRMKGITAFRSGG